MDHHRPHPSPPAFPPGVLLQSIFVDARGRESGYRIFHDGRYQSRTTGGAWTDGPALDEHRLAAVRQAVAAAGLEHLQPYYAAPEADDGGVLWIQIGENDPPRAVAIESPRRVPEVDWLASRLVAIMRRQGAGA
jgi:hypothetical protein